MKTYISFKTTAKRLRQVAATHRNLGRLDLALLAEKRARRADAKATTSQSDTLSDQETATEKTQ